MQFKKAVQAKVAGRPLLFQRAEIEQAKDNSLKASLQKVAKATYTAMADAGGGRGGGRGGGDRSQWKDDAIEDDNWLFQETEKAVVEDYSDDGFENDDDDDGDGYDD